MGCVFVLKMKYFEEDEIMRRMRGGGFLEMYLSLYRDIAESCGLKKET